MLAFLLVVELATLSRSGLLGLGVGLLVLAVPYRHHLADARVPRCRSAPSLGVLARRRRRALGLLRGRCSRSRIDTAASGTSTHFEVYDFIPDVLSSHPLFGLGLNNFSVYYEFVTGRTNWGPHSFYVALLVETGHRRDGALRGSSSSACSVRLAWPRARPRARGCRRPARGARAAARVGADRRARRDDRRERLLPDDVLLLLLRVRAPRARGAGRVRAAAARREGRRPDDVVPARRAATSRGASWRTPSSGCARSGVEVDVVSPALVPPLRDRVRRTGSPATCARGRGCVLLLPPFLLCVRARGAAGGAGRRRRPRALAPVRRCRRSRRGKPFVLQLWGTDVELARRAAVARPAAPAPRAARDRAPRPRSPTRRARSARARCASSRAASTSRARSASRTSRRTSSSSAGSREEKGDPRVPRGDARACRASSSATGRCATGARRRSASSPRPSSARYYERRGRRRASRRAARATASSRARRWRTGVRSSRRAVGGLVDVDGLARPAARRRRAARGGRDCSATPAGASTWARRRGSTPRRRCRRRARPQRLREAYAQALSVSG